MPDVIPKRFAPPKQYKQGFTEFYKLRFKLTQDVLIPRPETELLVDKVIDYAKQLWNLKQSGVNSTGNPNFVTVVDVGTGSGCIAISAAKYLPFAKVIAVDISEKALAIARLNSKLHRTDKQILFFQNDLLSGFNTSPDIIAANLPYIPTARLMHIDPMVRDFEPNLALDGGRDGFEIYRIFFAQILNQKLQPKLLICEIDDEQNEIALSEARHFFPKAEAKIISDLAKKNRFLQLIF